jgi:hypothetical protein
MVESLPSVQTRLRDGWFTVSCCRQKKQSLLLYSPRSKPILQTGMSNVDSQSLFVSSCSRTTIVPPGKSYIPVLVNFGLTRTTPDAVSRFSISCNKTMAFVNLMRL